MVEKFFQLLFKVEVKLCILNCRINIFRIVLIEQKYEVWGLNQNYVCNIDFEIDGFLFFVVFLSFKEVNFVLRGVLSYQFRVLVFFENGLYQQLEFLFLNNMKFVCEKCLGCCSFFYFKLNCLIFFLLMLLFQLLFLVIDVRLVGFFDYIDFLVIGV